jgi:hypothetical protein
MWIRLYILGQQDVYKAWANRLVVGPTRMLHFHRPTTCCQLSKSHNSHQKNWTHGSGFQASHSKAATSTLPLLSAAAPAANFIEWTLQKELLSFSQLRTSGPSLTLLKPFSLTVMVNKVLFSLQFKKCFIFIFFSKKWWLW